MRRLLAGLFILIFFIFVTPTFAQTPTPEPDPCFEPIPSISPSEELQSGLGGEEEFTTNPALECIDETMPFVYVTFHDLTPGEDRYVICTGSEYCFLPGFIAYFEDASIIPADKIQPADSEGKLTIKVCGNGTKKIKVDCQNDDFFWGGNVYAFSIGILKNDAIIPSKKAAFYVSRYYPNVIIRPDKNLTTDLDSFNINLSGSFRPPLDKNGKGASKRNNYQITVVGPEGYEKGKCINMGDIKGTTFSGPFPVGKYTITVKEEIDDSRSNTSIFLQNDWSDAGCQGGFTYYSIKCDVLNPKNGAGECTNPSLSKDPKGEEYKAFLKDIAELNKVGAGLSASFPCGDGKRSSLTSNPAGCKFLNTAIGPINITPQGFIESIFRIVLFLATFGGIIIIIYSGYMLMISRGDKEKVAGARETITSAIVGLLFIILSIVILEIIGVQILRLPGFGP